MGTLPTCYLQIQLLIPIKIRCLPCIYSEDITSLVLQAGICNAQRAVSPLDFPSKVESSLGLRLHLIMWMVCGHRIFIALVAPVSEPGDEELSGGREHSGGVGEGAGYQYTQALLHCHRPLHPELVPWILFSGPCGDTEAQRKLQPSSLPTPFPQPTHQPTSATAAAAEPASCICQALGQAGSCW